MTNRLRYLPHALMAAAVALQLALGGGVVILWQLVASVALLVLPGWLLSHRLGLLVRGTPERLVVTLAGSLTILGIGGFALNVTPLGLTTGGWIAWVVIATAVLAGAGVAQAMTARRVRRVTALVSNPHRPAPRRVRFAADLRLGQLVLLLLAAFVAIGAVTMARHSADAAASRGFTQLWILGPGVGVDELAPPPDSVRIGMENHESRPTSYRLVASSGGEVVGSWTTSQLADGARWTTLFPLPTNRSLMVELFRRGDVDPYRTVHLGPGSP